MLIRQDIEGIARRYLEYRLKPAPPATLRLVLSPTLFGKWTDLCFDRCKQLDQANLIPSKDALVLFIQDAAAKYAETMLKRAGKNPAVMKLTEEPADSRPTSKIILPEDF